MTPHPAPDRPTGYEPLGLPKPVAQGVWVIDGPLEAAGLVAVPTRAVVVQLPGGGLWVQAPGPLTASLVQALSALGELRHLVAPNLEPLPHLHQWRAVFPEAALWAPPASAHDRALELGGDAPPDWGGAFETILVDGSDRYREAVFFHRESRTLIAADLIHAIETAHLPAWQRPLVWLRGVDDNDPAMPPRLRRACADPAALGRAVERMVTLRPGRLLISHGRCFDTRAGAVLERSFRKLLRERQWTRALSDMDKSAPR